MMRIIFVMIVTLGLLQAEIVTDSVTKLQWQDDNVSDTMSWKEAKAYCQDLALGDFEDWRIPTIIELKTIVKRGRKPIAIKDDFKHTVPEHYWSLTSYDGNMNYLWNVFFAYGVVDFSKSDDKNYIRCVRGDSTIAKKIENAPDQN